MGVPGLWELLRPAGRTRSLTHLSVIDGYEANPGGRRGYRIGIDASIWFYHAGYGKEGENPELRTLFFRCCRLSSMPLLPLFVFDGPKRPLVKRGKHVNGNAHWLTIGMKNMVEAFGFEWVMAPGEAEAELAYLNHIGVIDAVLSDDVDSFLFGAAIVIQNPSNTLSGNRAHPVKNSGGKDDGNHAVIYIASDIASHPSVQLTREGMILIGLLSGGDYHPAGVFGCGKRIAQGLAQCGFGDSLLNAVKTLPRDKIPNFLTVWREEMREELRTNSKGCIGSKNPSLASKIPDDFPDINLLRLYTHPVTSETDRKAGPVSNNITWDHKLDLGKLAGLCELYFEWGVKDRIVQRFRSVLWPSAIVRTLQQATLDIDKEDSCASSTAKDQGPPSEAAISAQFKNAKDNGIIKIHSSRMHTSTDGLLEYRLEINPSQLVQLAEEGVKGIRPPVEPEQKQPPDPGKCLRIWTPASLVSAIEPHLVAKYEEVQCKKGAKKLAVKNTTAAVVEEGSKAFLPGPSRGNDTAHSSTGDTPVGLLKATTRKEPIRSLSFDNLSSQVTKYPRHNTTHTSPRVGGARGRHIRQPVPGDDVIEISSESDELSLTPVTARYKEAVSKEYIIDLT
ncbi:hypothetical protein BJ138DRAFT_1128532 [Hygrophoropsis aurantiaca]|uniref:Uncharacterized protein n=1 Tax=Hygrophoropsis aurantiaca TaxID=72124 RepID=A0ACB8A5L4_9AGAM|nr:hypothetical protein BJ138DRAFT_1128532 [Hygrophoropsis aurantiaca]